MTAINVGRDRDDDLARMPASPASATFFARQPIVDRKRAVVGYEMLFRGEWSDHGEGGSNSATAQTLSEIVFLANRNSAGSSLPVFVNFTHDVLLKGLGRLLAPPSGYVLEVLETVEPEAPVLEECRQLRALGMRIALDDVVSDTRIRAFAKAFDLVKVDVLDCPRSSLGGLVALTHGQSAMALAEKVETEDMMATALEAGFDFFQGFGLGRPRTRSARVLPGIPAVQVRLLDLLGEPDPSLAELEAVVGSDETLTYKVLRFANSARSAQRRPVDSIRSALVLLGHDQLRRAASLALLSGLAGQAPRFLLEQSVIRSRFCEYVGVRTAGRDSAGQFLLVGLLSNLNRLLGVHSLDEAIAPLSLADSIVGALVSGDGKPGTALALARAYEAADWETVDALSASLGIPPTFLPDAYSAAIQAASQLYDE